MRLENVIMYMQKEKYFLFVGLIVQEEKMILSQDRSTCVEKRFQKFR